jgi:hypothetical protein
MPPLGQLALALSACLTIMAGTGEFARAGSEADIATALAIRPGVADYMAQYGIK